MELSVTYCSLDSDSFDSWAENFMLNADAYLLKEVLISESVLDFIIINNSNSEEIEQFENFLDDNKNKNLLISSQSVEQLGLSQDWFLTKGFELITRAQPQYVLMRKSS